MQEQQVYSFKDYLLLNPLSSLPWPAQSLHHSCAVQYLCACSLPAGDRGDGGLGLDSLHRSLPNTPWLCDLPGACRDTLLIFRPRLFYTAREAHQPCFSTALQVPVKDPLGCSHPTRCACSSVHLGVLVPWPTAWAKNPGHVSSTW